MGLFKMDIKGLKCDSPKCDYKDMSIPSEDYHKWVGRNCPECGEILLTQSDHQTVLKLKAIENHPIVKSLNYIVDKLCFWKKPDTVELDLNGSGKLFLKKDK